MKTDKKYPRAFSHIGLTVPDIHKAVQFYSEVMDGTLLCNLQL